MDTKVVLQSQELYLENVNVVASRSICEHLTGKRPL